ncbi:MAG: Na+/H+ antiporter subunit E [Bacillota bacterium]
MRNQKYDFSGAILIFILLMGFWLLISSKLHWQHLITGTLFSLVLTFVWAEVTIGEHSRATSFNAKQVFLFIYYMICLAWEVVSANLKVAAIVLNPKLPISPGLVIMRNELKRDLSRVLYANSVTLTPGTITVDLEGDLHIVHAFTRSAGVGVQDWYLFNIIKKIEGEEAPHD